MSDHDELTTLLSRSLTTRSDAMSGSSLGLADVQGRARSIRRRRTATAVAGVAAAVALIVPTVALASHSNGKPHDAPPASQGTSPTQTATDDGSQPPAGVLDVRDLPTGDAPQVDYVTGKVLHLADGSTTDIGTQYPVRSFAVLKDGSRVWQTADDQGNAYVEVEDADGTFQEPVASDFGLSVSHSHDAAAWATQDGQVMVFTAGASAPRRLGDPVSAPQGLRMGPFGADDCVQDYCSVFVNVSSNNEQRPWEVADYATRPFTDGNMKTVADLAGGIFVGYTKITDFGSCSVLWGGGEFQGFDTCKHTLTSISPDGSLVLGTPAYPDGFGATDLAMYGIHGDLLFQRQSEQKSQASFQPPVWEDDSHVLASFYQDGKWSLVRIASDGTMEYAVPPAAGGEQDGALLETR